MLSHIGLKGFMSLVCRYVLHSVMQLYVLGKPASVLTGCFIEKKFEVLIKIFIVRKSALIGNLYYRIPGSQKQVLGCEAPYVAHHFAEAAKRRVLYKL